LANLGSESETCVGSRVRLVGVSVSFEKNFYRLPFTPPLRFAVSVLHMAHPRQATSPAGSPSDPLTCCLARYVIFFETIDKKTHLIWDESSLQYYRGTTLTDMWDRTHMSLAVSPSKYAEDWFPLIWWHDCEAEGNNHGTYSLVWFERYAETPVDERLSACSNTLRRMEGAVAQTEPSTLRTILSGGFGRCKPWRNESGPSNCIWGACDFLSSECIDVYFEYFMHCMSQIDEA
jgi:hypothetical protein